LHLYWRDGRGRPDSHRERWSCLSDKGEMAEWSNAVVLKTIDREVPGVRIPLSPQALNPAPTCWVFLYENLTKTFSFNHLKPLAHSKLHSLLTIVS
jgi:hypothetical protein